MDPVSVISMALAAGVAGGLRDTAGQALKDAYAGLKSLLKDKFRGHLQAEQILDRHEEAPEMWRSPLEEQLSQAGFGEDDEIIRAAQRVLALADPQGAQVGKYNIVVSGGKGIVVGDHANVTMTFDDSD